jgi:hypothetical protein
MECRHLLGGSAEPFGRSGGSLRVGGFLPLGARERTRRV